MSDRLGKALADILTINARKEATRTPRVNVPAPPVLNQAAQSAVSNIGQAVQQAAYQSPIASPPPPRLTYAQQLGEVVSQRASNPVPITGNVGVSTQPAIPMDNIRSMAEDAVRTTRERQEQEWGIYKVNDKQVAMPSYIADNNGFELLSETTTSDPKNVATMREHEWSYLKQDDETKAMIKSPIKPGLGDAVREAAIANVPQEKKSEALIEFATGAVTGAMKNAGDVAWNKNHAYVMVRANDSDDQVILTRSEWEEADDNWKSGYNVVTDAINEQEYQSIKATGVVDDYGEFRQRDQPQLDSTVTTMATEQAASAAQTATILTQRVVNARNEASRETAMAQDVVVINGRTYPSGTTEPWNLLQHSEQDRIGLEILPPAPKGWVWVSDGGANAWLEVEQRDSGGELILPEGAYEVRAYDEPEIYGLTDPIADKALWLFEGVVGDGVNWILESEHVPDIVKRGLEGFFNVVAMPQQKNLDNITRVILYPDETGTVAETLSVPVRILPPVARYEAWVTSNPDEARDAYENGYDSDNDGTKDVFGADAVTYLWRDEDLNGVGGSTTWFLFQLATDPLTYAAGAGVVGKVVGRAGSRWALSANPAVRVAGTVARPVGRGIEIGARVVEGAADLGAPFILDGGAWLLRRAGVTKATASALYKSEIDDVTTVHQEATTDKVSPLSTTARGVRVSTDDGLGWIYEPAPGDEAVTGPAARKRTGDAEATIEESRLADSTVPEGYEEVTRAGIATKTQNGWEIATDQGTITADSSATVDAVVNNLEGSEANPVPPRYRQKPIEEGQPVHYIDPLPREIYDILIENRLDDMAESVQWMKSLNVDTDGVVTTLSHLKESNRMARLIMSTTEEVNPGYSQPWHRNGGTSPAYVLAESFQRSDWPTAARWWGYLTGNGETVDLPGGRYRATTAILDLDIPQRRTPVLIKRANDSVDVVMDRLHWNPGDITIPEFAAIVSRAAELDHWLRSNDLRYSNAVHDLPAITTLIPENSGIEISADARAMAPYNGSPIPSVASAGDGEFIGSIRLTPDGSVVLDLYEVMFEQVPDGWAQMFPEEASGTWTRAYANVADGEGFNVYAPDAGWANQMAQETLAARGIEVLEGIQPVDHVANAQAPQEAVGSTESGATAETDSLPATDGISVPEPNTAAGTSAADQPSPSQLAADADAATVDRQARINQAVNGIAEPQQGHMVPKVSGVVEADPTGTLEMPVYEQTVDVEPASQMSTAGQKVVEDVFKLPELSQKFKAIGTRTMRNRDNLMPRSGVAVEAEGPGRFYLGRRLDAPEAEVLTRHPFPDGETLLDRVNRKYFASGNADGWKNHFDFYEDLAWTESLAEYEAHLIELPQFQPGVLPQPVKNTIAKLPVPVQRVLEGVAWAMRKLLLGPYDRLNRFYRERTLFRNDKFLHYPAVQYFGNLHLAGAGGKFREMAYMLNLRNVKRSFDTVTMRQTSRPTLLWGETQTPNQKLLAKLGLSQSPETSDVFRNLGAGRVDDLLIGQKWLDSKGKAGKVASKVVGSRWSKEMGAAMDYLWRDAIEYASNKSGIGMATPDFRNMIHNRLVKSGVDSAEAQRFWSDFIEKNPTGEFAYNDLVSHYSPLVGRTMANRIAGDWRQTLNKIRKDTRANIRKYGFAQPETRVDLVAKRAFAFHFFQSRQTWFLMRQMADHPFLINLYFTLQEELERYSEDWPPYLRGWIKFLPSTAGRQMFVNPTALLQTYTMFKESYSSWDQGEMVDGEGESVGFWPWFLNTAVTVDQEVGLAIPISKAMNVTGMRGDIWSPDLLAINSEANIATLTWNWLEFLGVVPGDGRPNGNVNTDFNNLVREKVSGIIPGTEKVTTRSSAQSMDVEVTNIAMDIAKNEMGLDPENDGDYRIILTLLNDPESELYRKAYKTWLTGETYEVGSRMIVGPWRPRFRQTNSDGEDLNTNRTQREKSAANTADKRVGLFWLQNDQYYEIGTDRTNGASSMWTDIVYGQPMSSVTVNGITYSRAEIMAMDTEQRKAIANGAMAELGLMDDINGLRDERAIFLAQPENAYLAQYHTWSQSVRDYPGGPEKYWQDVAAGNPNAATYYNNFILTASSEEEKQRMMTGTVGMFHILGWDHSAWDKPIIGYESPADVYDPAGVLDQPAQPRPYEEPNADFKNEVRQAPVFLGDMQAYDAAAQDKMAEMGYPPGTSFRSLPSKQRIAIEEALEADGIYEPKMNYGTQKYLEWVEQQPAGADVSVEAFLAANQNDYYEGMPAKTSGNVNTTKPIPGPDVYGNTAPSTAPPNMWSDIFDLLNEYDHNRYKDPWSRP